MKVAIASDHAGFPYKAPLILELETMGYQVIDFGPSSISASDYPNYAFLVGEAIKNQKADLGVLICGTGIGMAIAANKVKGVRAASCHNERAATLMREHNHVNVLCVGSRMNTIDEVKKFVKLFMETPINTDSRHLRRVNLIKAYEEGN